MESDMGGIERAIMGLFAAHLAFHDMEAPGPDDATVLVSLGERDLLLIGMGLPALELFFLQQGVACFSEASADLQNRLMELVHAQHPEWTQGKGGIELSSEDEE